MSTDERDEKMARQIQEIHAVVLGVDGQGGLYRQVQCIEKDVAELKTWKARAIAWVAGATTLAAAAGVKIGALFTGSK